MNKTVAVQSILDDYFCKTRDADNNRDVEVKAAITIQRVFRGWLVRKRLRMLHFKAILIQTILRGFLQRKSYKKMLAEVCHRKRMEYFNKAATTIQKMWRGYYIRKYACDFGGYYKRKEYLKNLESKNEEMRIFLDNHVQRQLQLQKEEAFTEYHNQVVSTSKNLHHLISTKKVPSIFNSPYSTVPATLAGQDVEDVIRSNTHTLLQQRKEDLKTKRREERQKTIRDLETKEIKEDERRERAKSYGKLRSLRGTERIAPLKVAEKISLKTGSVDNTHKSYSPNSSLTRPLYSPSTVK